MIPLKSRSSKALSGWRPTRRQGDLLALAAGALLPLAFAPFHLYPLAVLLPAILFALWLQDDLRAGWRGYLFGLGLFGVGVSWVYVSLHDFGHMPWPLAGLIVTLFVAVLAAFPAGVGWLQARIPNARSRLLLFVPAAWVLLEWVRSWVLTGFPWLNLGYSQTDSPLAGYAPVGGVFAVSWVTVLSAALLVMAWQGRRPRLVALSLIAVLWIAGAGLSRITWTQPVDGPLHVALVQGNVPLEIKWQPAFRDAILDRYVELSRAAADARLVVWPETAAPGYLHHLTEFMQELDKEAQAQDKAVLFGVVEEVRASAPRVYNSVIGIGDASGVYRKQHLVPFGEFLPFESWLSWLLDYLHIPMSSFSRWQEPQAPIVAAGQKVGVSICYEDAFGEEIIRALPEATLLVNVSEDAWFGRSFAPHQHLQKARMRAIESERVLLRSTNTGLSAVIDAKGKIVAASPPFTTHVLTATVQPRRGATPYVYAGNLPIISLAFVLAGLGAWRARRLPAGRSAAPVR